MPSSVAELRVNYSKEPLDENSLTDSPFPLFATWFSEAMAAKEHEPNAMCLSTADKTGRPSARMVLLKGFDNRGFVWYTNYGSRKASQLDDNPFAALTFWWPTMERSVRVEGVVTRVSEDESDAYFDSRPPSSRLGAWASDQSREISGRAEMEHRWELLQRNHLDADGNLIKRVDRPKHWGGFRLIPDRVEFWKGRSARLHDRIQFERKEPLGIDSPIKNGIQDVWMRKRLQP